MKGLTLEQVKNVKLLGVTLDERLSWSYHIDKIITKMGCAMSAIRGCRDFMTDHSINIVIKSLVLSHLDYWLKVKDRLMCNLLIFF